MKAPRQTKAQAAEALAAQIVAFGVEPGFARKIAKSLGGVTITDLDGDHKGLRIRFRHKFGRGWYRFYPEPSA